MRKNRLKMKKKGIQILIFFLFFISNRIAAQDLFVYHLNGEVTYSDNNAKNKKAFYNYKVQASTIFHLESNATLFLRDKSYSMLYINKNGDYKAKQLADFYKNKGKQENFTQKTITYLAAEYMRSDEDIRAYAKENMRQSGGVSRGCNPGWVIMPLKGQIISDSIIHFKWEALSTNLGYRFKINEVAQNSKIGKLIFEKEITNQMQLELELKDLPDLKQHTNYRGELTSEEDNTCFQFSFSIASNETIKQLKDSLNQQVDHRQPLKDQLVNLAMLYEENGLLQEALECLNTAFTITDNTAFLNLAQLFTARNQ